ncbi:MAG: NAD(P)-dependent oxidoreductase [Bacteroidota bacterium]
MTTKILIGTPLAPHILEDLNKTYLVEAIDSKENRFEQIYERIADYEAVMILGTAFDRECIEKGSKLRIISNYAVGYDNVDIAFAKEKGIAVTNIPGATTTPTATYSMSLLLALLRKIVLNDRKIRQGRIEAWGSPAVLGHAPEGRTLGILGMGRIGQNLAKKALAFEMKILYHNRNRLSEDIEQACQARYVSFEELLEHADVISINAPLNDQNRQIMNAQAFSRMKSSAFLINTARGGHVDEAALIHALQTQSIAGAALDVFPEEPTVNPLFFDMDNVILSPHNGSGTKEDRRYMFQLAFENIVNFLEGRHEHISRVV